MLYLLSFCDSKGANIAANSGLASKAVGNGTKRLMARRLAQGAGVALPAAEANTIETLIVDGYARDKGNPIDSTATLALGVALPVGGTVFAKALGVGVSSLGMGAKRTKEVVKRVDAEVKTQKKQVEDDFIDTVKQERQLDDLFESDQRLLELQGTSRERALNY